MAPFSLRSLGLATSVHGFGLVNIVKMGTQSIASPGWKNYLSFYSNGIPIFCFQNIFLRESFVKTQALKEDVIAGWRPKVIGWTRLALSDCVVQLFSEPELDNTRQKQKGSSSFRVIMVVSAVGLVKASYCRCWESPSMTVIYVHRCPRAS